MKFPDSVYISGPVTGMPYLNKPAFMKAEFYLKSQGYIVINPIKTVLPCGEHMERLYARPDPAVVSL